MAPSTSGFAIASLILSILSWVGFVGFGAILGIIFGHIALNEINRSGGQLQGRGYAVWGLILGYAHIVAVVVVGLVVVFILLGIIAINTQTH
jgi:hypothetical protein